MAWRSVDEFLGWRVIEGAKADSPCLVHDQTPPFDPDVDTLADFEGETGILPQVSGDIEDQSTLRMLIE